MKNVFVRNDRKSEGRKYLFQEKVKGNLLKVMLHIVYKCNITHKQAYIASRWE